MENIKIQEVTGNDIEFLFHLMNDASIMKALNEIPTQRKCPTIP